MADYETIEYRGHQIITGFEDYDLDIFDPRDNDGNVGAMHCAHRNYNLGDEQTDPESMTVECPWCEGDGEVRVPAVGVREEHGYGYTDPSTIVCPKCEGDGEVVSPIQWAVEQGATVVLALYLYDHSGISMSAVTCYKDGERLPHATGRTGWDSGMVGIIFDTPEGLRGAMGKHEYVEGKYTFTGDWHTDDNEPPKCDWVEGALHAEVKVYDAYLTGDIMYYRTEGPVDDDGCGGFFPDENGSHQYMIDEAKASIDHAIRHSWEQGINEVLETIKVDRMMAL